MRASTPPVRTVIRSATVALLLFSGLLISTRKVCSQDEEAISAAQEERESSRWSPEQDVRDLQKAEEEDQLELGRQAQSAAESLRDDDSAARRAVEWQKDHALEERIKQWNDTVDAPEQHELNQAKVDEEQEVQDAIGFSGTQLIDLGLERPQRELDSSYLPQRDGMRSKEAALYREQERLLLNEQKRLEVLQEPAEAESLEDEIGTFQNHIENLTTRPSLFYPGMPLENPAPFNERSQSPAGTVPPPTAWPGELPGRPTP